MNNDSGSPRLPEGGVINCNGNGILNQNQVNPKFEERVFDKGGNGDDDDDGNENGDDDDEEEEEEEKESMMMMTMMKGERRRKH